MSCPVLPFNRQSDRQSDRKTDRQRICCNLTTKGVLELNEMELKSTDLIYHRLR